MELATLSTEDMVSIYDVLVNDFAGTSDPISPPGVRSMALLESAVGRQHTSHDGILKYPDPVSNAATLAYGICCDHPFFNGNKRTALVAMLVHLDRNHLTLYQTLKAELYDLMINIANHCVTAKPDKKSKTRLRPSADDEVEEVTRWLAERAYRVRRGEKNITYRELQRILADFDIYLENPEGNSIDVVRHETVRKGLLKRRDVTVKKRIGSIAWPGRTVSDVAISEIKKVRKMCNLREEDGVDSDAFYSYTLVVDSFVNRYRTVLRRLART